MYVLVLCTEFAYQAPKKKQQQNLRVKFFVRFLKEKLTSRDGPVKVQYKAGM